MLQQIVQDIADCLKRFDSSRPIHKSFQPGIGPFGEPQVVQQIALALINRGYKSATKRTPDLALGDQEWALEFKIVRPFGDNGREAENWSVNLLHPYKGNTSSIGDIIKLREINTYRNKGIIVIGYEHRPAKISLDPLIESFEKIAIDVIQLPLGERIEERREDLVHPIHQVVRCFGWQIL